MKLEGEIFGELTIKRHIKSLLQAVRAIHKAGYLHLDLKPENMIFVGDELKLTDFGTVFDHKSYKIDQETNVFLRMKPYVSTRWYRAPECVMECMDYSQPVDVFALGCVMAEMFMFHPLFPGINQQEQLFKYVQVLGSPQPEEWPEMPEIDERFKSYSGKPLNNLIPNATTQALDVMRKMLEINPYKRISVEEALAHPFFQEQVVQDFDEFGFPLTSPEKIPQDKKKPVKKEYSFSKGPLENQEDPNKEVVFADDHLLFAAAPTSIPEEAKEEQKEDPDSEEKSLSPKFGGGLANHE